MSKTPPIVVEPKNKDGNELEAQAAVIWLHGLGADGYDFLGVLPQLNLPTEHHIRFIFPHADEQPVTINGGMRMRSWYDIRSPDLLNDVDADGIRIASYQVYDLIDQQIKAGIDPKKIILAGFSQGGLIALHAGLGYQQSLGGIMALSTYCPMEQQFNMHLEMPIFMVHGTEDSVVPLALAEHAYTALSNRGYQIEWHTYLMGHQVCGQELMDIRAWLFKALDIE
ncbi:alpha/beta hydrolase [Thiomicrorhabdus heinhorstiae]|uniref:Alpha/beta hydrolase fold domain-containing protein n=1 Tax=Thiomicrorhabdus heinhorstiae TaxID=2748010 RepID=A0ABS0BVE0_9GAMM|nr:alpha/beta hydrolase fold domain-containing protein [Thiomicrorhabdus heinhorstiae]MBF6057793.1 alpha/beta hydrolase fold domain-containing protein [Thiomicrorhabdus heinhorstiae]